MRKTKKSDFFNYFKKHYALYLMLALPIIYYIVFHYAPLAGISIAFKNYNIKAGIWGSEWVGFDVFTRLFASSKFWRALRNTLMLNFLALIFSFPAPIILALLLNELQNGKFKKSIQTILYLPHFMSWVAVGGIVVLVFAPETGLINMALSSVGLPKIPFLSEPVAWVATYIGVTIWQSIGWGAIIYISAISGIDQEQYEAAKVDGCSRFKMMYKITVPNIMPTIILMFILRVGGMVNLGLEKAQMLGNDMVLSVSEVLSTYSYQVGMQRGQFSNATAISLFQAIVNFTLVVSANKISDKLSGESIW